MRTIVSPACSKIVANKSKDSVFWREHSCNKLGGREAGFFSSRSKHGRVGFLYLIRNNYKGYSPVLASSQSQEELETAETKNQSINESKTVRVRFLLQKECAYGEQFLLVGDDPVLGSWDPESAVPLNWSDGHVWVVELDAPVEKSIQYKFLLREITGKITWQPEPDRIIQTWSTANTIAVSEDWQDAALQQIVEEEPQADQNAESTGSSEILIVAENLAHQKEDSVPPFDAALQKIVEEESQADQNAESTGSSEILTVAENLAHQKEESVPRKSKKTTIGDENPYAAKNSSLSSAEKQIVLAEKQVAIVADNISYPQQNPAVNATGHVQDQKRINNSTDEPIATADMTLVAGKEIMASNGRDAVGKSESEDVNGSLFVHEGGPVLVPGLSSLPSVPNEVAFHVQDESKKSTDSDTSLGVDEIKNDITPKTIQVDEKHETADSMIIGNEQPEEETAQKVSDGDYLKSEINQAPKAKQENKQEVSENPESNVLHNDIKWGRQTLQKLLSNLGFM